MAKQPTILPTVPYTTILFLLCILCWDLNLVHGYASGPPETDSVCNGMVPGHGVAAQESEVPVTFNLTEGLFFRHGDYIPVTLIAANGNSFKGFLLEARLVSSPDTIVGVFDSGSLPSGVKVLKCQGRSKTAVSHSMATDKTSVTVTWQAAGDSNITGDVFFRVTIVKYYSEFWVGMNSTALTLTLEYSNFTAEIPPPSNGSAVKVMTSPALFASFFCSILLY